SPQAFVAQEFWFGDSGCFSVVGEIVVAEDRQRAFRRTLASEYHVSRNCLAGQRRTRHLVVTIISRNGDGGERLKRRLNRIVITTSSTSHGAAFLKGHVGHAILQEGTSNGAAE